MVLSPLTDSVTLLTTQINNLMDVLAPLATAERDVGRVEHLFSRHRHTEEPPEQP
jgi:hypothetical protein